MATLFSGGSFTKMKTIFQHMGLACVSLNTFFKHQQVTCFPVQNVIQLAFVNLLLVMQHQFISSRLNFFVFSFGLTSILRWIFFIFPTFPIIQYHYRYLSKPVFNSNFRLGCSPLYISFGSATKQTCSLSSRFWGILQ